MSLNIVDTSVEPIQKSSKPAHPAKELIKRYVSIFMAVWKIRHELVGPKRLVDENAFLPAALSLQETPVHPAPRRTAWVLMGLFSIAVIWAIFGKIDIVAVSQGRIVVSERTKVIQPLERSVVKRIFVKDGDRVKAGQVLVELDSTMAAADQSSIEQQLASSKSEVLRSEALLHGLDKQALPTLSTEQTGERYKAIVAQLQAEWSDISAKLAKLNSEIVHRNAEIATVQASINKLQTTLPLAKKRESDIQSLAASGFVANHLGQDRTRERIEMEQDLSMQKAHLKEAEAFLLETNNAKTSYLAETRRTLNDRLAEATLKHSQLLQEDTKAQQRTKLTQLTAPVDGTIQQMAIHTAGGVVTEAQALMIVVPSDAQVTADVVLDNKDIGFVSPGQHAEIKLETFLFTKYGTIPAVVQTVTADAVNDEKKGAIFPATLKLQQNIINVDGKQIRLSPGMNVTAEIKTGKRRVIEYLLSPIQKATKESLIER